MSRTAGHDVVVVDTDVVSFIFKGDTRGTLYEAQLDGKLGVIAAQTRAELERWALLHNWGTRRHSALRLFLKRFVLAEVVDTTCLKWAEIMVSAHRTGRAISVADAWIAATALTYTVPLVTHNPSDFKNVLGLTVITEK
jgi:predicted nucleic acid-binding protein